MKFLLWGIGFALLSSLAVAGYESPNPQGLGIEPASISLPESTRGNLATAIAKCCGNLDAEKTALRERMVAIALLVSPRNRDAVVLDARLQKERPPSPDLTWPLEKTAAGLASLGKRLKSGKAADRRLAGYFFSLASDLVPDDDDLLYALSTHEKGSGAVDWSGIHGGATSPSSSTPAPKADPNRVVIVAGEQAADASVATSFKRNQMKVNGLVVRDLGAALSGDILEIVITILPWHLPNVTRLEFATPVGNDMNVSFNEAISLMRTRYPNLPGGKKMRVSFDDKYTLKDGGSAGLAFALIGFALLDGLQLDPAAAVTGDVTVDWLVRDVAGVSAKIAGAQRSGKSLVVIPAGNAADIEDMVLLGGVESLMRTQILAVENVAQAIEILRTDRTGKLQGAMDEFAKLEAALDAGRKPNELMGYRAVRSIVTKTAADVPEHVSARYLVKVMEGWKPQKLSLEGSLSEVTALLWPYGRILKGYGSREFDLITDEILIESMVRANRLNQYADPKVKLLAKSLYDLVYAHADYRGAKKDGNKFRTELKKWRDQIGGSRFRPSGLQRSGSGTQGLLAAAYRQRSVVTAELQKLGSNHHFIEALLR